MQKSDIHILIVEDDSTLGKALEEGFKRDGYQPKLVNNADDARASCKLHDYHVAIVDCMIPKMNGVELSVLLRKELGPNLMILLTSGIYKDKQFSREAIARTQASAFFTKPFDMEKVIEAVNKQFADSIEENKGPFHSLLKSNKPTLNEKLSALQNSDFIHGYQLPFVYSLLVDTQWTGDLTITASNEEVMRVIFDNGKIIDVDKKDDKSFFGVLLVETGFTTFEAVNEALAHKSGKPIGQRLVELNSMSPHAIDIIRQKQMVIRLSKTIFNDSVKITLLNKDSQPPSYVYVDQREIPALLNDWVASKLTLEWLKAFYMPWLDSPILPAENFDRLSEYKNQPLLIQSSELTHVFKNKSIQDLYDMKIGSEEDVLRAIHLMIISRTICFQSSSTNLTNFEKRMERLEKLFGDIDSKNHFEVLGLNARSRVKEVNQAYHDFAKALHPDKLPQDAPEDLRKLTEHVFSRINEAYKVLSNEKKREEYLKILEHGELEEALEAEAAFDLAKKALSQGKYDQAFDVFNELSKSRGQRADLIVYLIWAKIKVGRRDERREEFIKNIKKLMGQVPHEERHNHIYFFVRGLYYKLAKNYEKAAKYFKHSSSVEPQFIEAKRELVKLKNEFSGKSKRQQTVTTTSDLSTVITRFFSRKKSG